VPTSAPYRARDVITFFAVAGAPAAPPADEVRESNGIAPAQALHSVGDADDRKGVSAERCAPEAISNKTVSCAGRLG
jgi:hypothetical protein